MVLFQSRRESFLYYPSEANPKQGLFAVRYKQYKAHYFTKGSALSGPTNVDHDCSNTSLVYHSLPLLFDLNRDPGERYDLSTNKHYQSILEEIGRIRDQLVAGMTWGKSQINGTDPDVEPCCSPGCKPFPKCCKCKGSEVNFITV